MPRRDRRRVRACGEQRRWGRRASADPDGGDFAGLYRVVRGAPAKSECFRDVVDLHRWLAGGTALALETTIVELLDTRGPEHLRGRMLVPLQKVFTDSAGLTDAAVLERLPAEANAEPGREVRGHAGEKETVGREIHLQAIRPEDLTALVCGHEARAVTDWDNETGILKALRYEHVEQAR